MRAKAEAGLPCIHPEPLIVNDPIRVVEGRIKDLKTHRKSLWITERNLRDGGMVEGEEYCVVRGNIADADAALDLARRIRAGMNGASGFSRGSVR
jgi:hypothetical protein